MQKQIHILYIDDSAMDRALVRDSLEREHGGFILTEAKSQRDFEKLISKKSFDLILSDFNILGYEGLQVLDYVKSNYPHIPVIIVTGTGSEEVAVESMKKGASDYVLKSPKHIKRLPETINSVLKSKLMEIERNSAVIALEESEKKFRALYENAPIPHQSLNEEGTIKEINPAWLKVLGYNKNEVINKYFGDFLHPESKLHFEKKFPEFKKTGSANDVQFKMRCKTGSFIDVSFNGCVGRNPDGSFQQTYCVFQNITEKKIAENMLRENEALLRKISENYPNSYISIIEKDLTIGFTSGQQFIINNINPNDFVGLSIEKIFGENTELVKENYLRAFRGEKSSFELLYGEEYQLYKCVPLYNDNNEITRILVTVEVITERKNAEIALSDSEKKYRDLVENLNDIIYSVDAGGIITYLSPASEMIFGYKPDELVGSHFIKLVHPDDANRIMHSFEEVLQGSPEVREYRMITKDDQVKNVRTSSRPVMSEGLIKGLQGVLYDITELRSVEEEFSRIFNLVPELICVASSEGYFLKLNPAWERVLGFSTDELLAQPFSSFIHPDDIDRTHREVEKQVSGQRTSGFVNRYRTKNGSFKWLEWAASPSPDGKKLFASARDITERIENEEKIKLQMEELQRWYDATLGREKRIIELKQEVNDLLGKMEKPLRYKNSDELNLTEKS